MLSIGTLINGIKKTKALNKAKAQGENVVCEISWDRLRGPLVTTGVALLYILAMHFIGFYVATTIFLPSFMLLQGYRKIKVIVFVTILMDVLVYICFSRMLMLQLPAGLLI